MLDFPRDKAVNVSLKGLVGWFCECNIRVKRVTSKKYWG
jgi:hypothetical protein